MKDKAQSKIMEILRQESGILKTREMKYETMQKHK